MIYIRLFLIIYLSLSAFLLIAFQSRCSDHFVYTVCVPRAYGQSFQLTSYPPPRIAPHRHPSLDGGWLTLSYLVILLQTPYQARRGKIFVSYYPNLSGHLSTSLSTLSPSLHPLSSSPSLSASLHTLHPFLFSLSTSLSISLSIFP